MDKKFLAFLALPFMCCCSGTANNVEEFGNARITADYFFRDYTDFFSYDDKDYALVGKASDEVIKSDYLSAINGKFFTSYKFYKIENYNTHNIIVVNFFNKLKKIDTNYIYASKDAISVPINYLADFVSNSSKDSKTINNKVFYQFEDALQPISLGNLVLKETLFSYYEVVNHPCWVVRLDSNSSQKLFYSENIKEIEMDIIWAIRDNVIHEKE